MVENLKTCESSSVERARSLADLAGSADICASWTGHESGSQRTASLGTAVVVPITTHSMFVTSPSSSKLSTSQSGGLSRAGNSARSAVLSRQPSFDFGGEGKLSSTQVKQRLKTHLLNRQKRGHATDRLRRGDDSDSCSTTSSMDASGYGFSPKTDPNSEAFTGKRGTYWHSADSATSNNWDPSDDASATNFPTQHRSFDLSIVRDPADSHPVVGSISPLSVRSCHDSPHPLAPAVLNAIEQLTAAQSELKSIGRAPTNESHYDRAQFVEESPRTQSESDLFELSHLVRFLSQYLSKYSTELSASHEVNTHSLASHHLAFMSNHVPMSHLFQQPTSQYSSMNPRPTILEPLLEPPHVTDSSELLRSNDDVCYADANTPCMDLSTTFPVLTESHSSLRPAGTGGFNAECVIDTTMKSNYIECPSSDARRDATVATRVPVPACIGSVGVGVGDGEIAMEWESDSCANNVASKRSSVVLSHSPASSSSVSQMASMGSPVKHTILSLWASLPIEDWTAESIKTVPPAMEFNCLPTALAFDPEMLGHACLCPGAHDVSTHPESPERMRLILERLMDSFLQIPPSLSFGPKDLLRVLQAAVAIESPSLQQELSKLTNLDPVVLNVLISRIPLIGFCRLLRARMVTDDELCVFHSRNYVTAFGYTPQPPADPNMMPLSTSTQPHTATSGCTIPRFPQHLCKLGCGGLGVDSDTVWNPITTACAARLAVGQVLCLAHKVVRNEIRNGIALVRPPGHHAEPDQPMGFCYFNSVSVAALHMLRNPRVSRVLILDWDIHHGNGTKLATSLHPGLLYISIHRYDGGTFFPGTGSATEQVFDASDFSPPETNSVDKSQRTQLINVAWESPTMSSVTSNVQNSVLNAGDRRELWRQYCFRRRQAARVDLKLSDDLHCSTETSTTSLCSPAGVTNIDTCPCSCHGASGSRAVGSTASSSQCSFCLSHSTRSSTSSIRSESVAHNFTPAFGADQSAVLSRLTNNSSLSNAVLRPPLLGLGDAEYLAAMRCVVIPIVHEFQPDFILISAGFDAANGHGEALGGYNVSPGWFAWATRQCLSLADSRVVLALEGGHIPAVMSDCFNACLNSLLLPRPLGQWVPYLGPPCSAGLKSPSSNHSDAYLDALRSASDWISHSELHRRPCAEAVSNLLTTIRFHGSRGWRCMQDVSDENVALSFMEAIGTEQLQTRSSGTLLPVHLDSESKTCHSPLTAGFAQLRMDHS